MNPNDSSGGNDYDYSSWIRLLGLGYFARNRFNTQLRKFCRRSIVNSNPVAASQGLQIPVAALTRGSERCTQPTVTKRRPSSPLVIVPAKAWTFGHGSPLENTRRPRARCAIWTLKARPQASVTSPFLLGVARTALTTALLAAPAPLQTFALGSEAVRAPRTREQICKSFDGDILPNIPKRMFLLPAFLKSGYLT